MNRNHTYIVILALFLSVIFLLYPKVIQKNDNDGDLQILPDIVTIDDAVFNVDIVDTKMERNKGLSGRKSLNADSAMLFVFEESGVYPFWMKGMNFSIDIIWISEDLKVVYMKELAIPESYPEVFTPTASAKYVLEVNTGIVKNEGIKIGSDVILNILNTQ